MHEAHINRVASQLRNGMNEDAVRASLRQHDLSVDEINAVLAAAKERNQANHLSHQPNQSEQLDDPQLGPALSTPPQIPESTLPSVGELISDSFTQTTNRLDLVGYSILVQIAAVLPMLGVVALFLVDVAGALGGESEMVPIALGVPLALIAVVAAIVLSVLNAAALIYITCREERVTYWSGFRWGWKNIWSLAWVWLLFGLVTLAGYALFIIPGIILGIYLMFSLFVLADEGRRGLAALVRSHDLVYGFWWGVLGRLFVLVLVMMLAGFMVGLPLGMVAVGFEQLVVGAGEIVVSLVQFGLQAFFTVFLLVAAGRLYRSLRARRPEFDAEAHAGTLISFRVAAWIGLVVPIAFSIFVAVTISSLAHHQAQAQRDAMVVNLNQARVTADVYYLENGDSYEGICDHLTSGELVYDTSVDCEDSGRAYALEVELATGDYYCIDSQGASEMTPEPRRSGLACITSALPQ